MDPAEALKQEGNEALGRQDYNKAIEFYTAAIKQTGLKTESADANNYFRECRIVCSDSEQQEPSTLPTEGV